MHPHFLRFSLMKKWFTQTFLTAIALLLACKLFPRVTFAAAFVVQHDLAFGSALALAAVICKSAVQVWWATHIQLRGVGGKSGWQRKQRGDT